jgi:type III pantothenate kinase
MFQDCGRHNHVNKHATVLAIDAGNTRVKWGMHDGGGWVRKAWIESSRAGDLAAEFSALSPSLVVVANVAGPGRRDMLAAILPPAPVRWIAAQRMQCGVRNDYADPAQLGADRWAALIGAHARGRGPLVVVGAGTALTVDALTAEGVFLGGIIVAGAQLMRESLYANTARLTAGDGEFSMFPRTTGDAIASGVIDAQCGAIERMTQFAERATGSRPRCILSGGGAALIAAHLAMDVEVVDNLVLEGLITIARDLHTQPVRGQA